MSGLAPARGRFREIFGRDPDAVAEAPGRVNLIGEHTDYNGGFVLPTAIPQVTRAEIARRSDRTVRLSSESQDGGRTAEYTLGGEKRRRSWIDYAQGVTAELARRGLAIAGFDLRISSSVPLGAGLSSSAAFEISLLRALRTLFDLALDEVALALCGQRAENDLVGAPVGVMDQMASSLASRDVALFLDTRSLAFERIPIPSEAGIVVIDSGVRHDHATGDYGKRRAECGAAAALLGVGELRDVAEDRLPEIARLPAPLDRRARHVVTENARVVDAAEALRTSDLPRLGILFDASHDSERDDFDVSVPPVDALVEAARRQRGVYGARLTGGGFGGSVVILVRSGAERAVADRVVSETRASAAKARVLIPGEDETPATHAI